jgi:hypothetical protein
MEPIDTYEHEGITINVYPDDSPEAGNPREGDQLTTLVCWHPDYVLGDEQIQGSRGAVETPFHEGGEGVTSMRQVYRYLGIVREAVCILPLYLYDHSGISITAGAPNPFDNPTVRRDDFGQGMGWDTSMVGFVYTTHERITELCGDGEPYHSDEWIREQVEQDVRLYDMYLQGAVYGYVVAEDSHEESSCWGFLGWDHEQSGLLMEAKAEAADIAEERARLRALPWLPTFGNSIQKAVAS